MNAYNFLMNWSYRHTSGTLLTHPCTEEHLYCWRWISRISGSSMTTEWTIDIRAQPQSRLEQYEASSRVHPEQHSRTMRRAYLGDKLCRTQKDEYLPLPSLS